MKCAVAIVLALIGLAMAHPSGYGIGLASAPIVLPSAVSVSSSIINHGVTIPRLAPITVPIISAPIIKTPIITPIVKAPIITPILTAPILKAPILTAPILSAPIIKSPLLGLGGLGGLGGYGGWH